MATDLRKLKKFRLPAGALIVVVSAFITYMLRGGFRRFESAPYNPPPAAFTNWNDVLTHPRDISVVTFQTGVVHMDACLNLDPTSPKQAECDHVPTAEIGQRLLYSCVVPCRGGMLGEGSPS